jgi:hypothetical protein
MPILLIEKEKVGGRGRIRKRVESQNDEKTVEKLQRKISVFPVCSLVSSRF